MKHWTLILGLVSVTLLPGCGTLSKVDQIADQVLSIKRQVETKVEEIEAKLDERGTEVATLGEEIRVKLGKDVLTKDDIDDIAKTPSLWRLLYENWGDALILVATLLAGGKVAGGTLTTALRSFHAKGRALVGPGQPPSPPQS